MFFFGLGVILTIKYFYQTVKKFFVRKYGSSKKTALDPQFAEQLALNMQELTRIATPSNSQTSVGPAAAAAVNANTV
jgi:hypothetical protein